MNAFPWRAEGTNQLAQARTNLVTQLHVIVAAISERADRISLAHSNLLLWGGCEDPAQKKPHRILCPPPHMVHMCVTHGKRAAVEIPNPFKYDLGAIRNFVGEIARTPQVAATRLMAKKHAQPVIGYIGWSGHRNLGDEALFEAIQNGLRDVLLLPLLPEPGERMLTRWGLGGRSLFRAVLLGGGTLVNSSFLPMAKLAHELGLPLYTVGTGVGSPGFGMPLDSNALGNWNEILEGCDFLSVRGPLSASALRNAGLEEIQIIGDPALGLTPERVPAFRMRRRLVINLAREKTDYPLFKDVAAIAKEFLQDGGEVVGVALGSGDRAVIERFRRTYRLPDLRVEEHRRSAEDFLATVAGSTALIGVRLHSAVLACCVGVPCILLAYRSKCFDFMQSMNLDEFCLPLDGQNSGALLRACWRKILFDPGLGEQVYRQAVFWKHKQQSYFARLADRLQEQPLPSHMGRGAHSRHLRSF